MRGRFFGKFQVDAPSSVTACGRATFPPGGRRANSAPFRSQQHLSCHCQPASGRDLKRPYKENRCRYDYAVGRDDYPKGTGSGSRSYLAGRHWRPARRAGVTNTAKAGWMEIQNNLLYSLPPKEKAGTDR